MSTIKKITVIGATGMLCRPVVRELSNAGFELTLLARDHDKTQKLFPLNTISKGDVFDKESLLKALENSDALYLNLSTLPDAKPGSR